LVPDLAKKLVSNGLVQGRRREPQIRYIYQQIPGRESKPVKVAVIKKATQKAPPKDLIQLLIEKKYQMYQHEQKILQELYLRD